jgi:hypothetical protein
LLRPLTALKKQTSQLVCAIKLSIYLDVYGRITQGSQGKHKHSHFSQTFSQYTLPKKMNIGERRELLEVAQN